jgi:ABC-type Fe3+ transport system substrate-binding protein/flagellar hook-basal body complex protein FliE
MKKLLAIFIALLFASNSFAASGKVVVVTSFPKDLSGKFKAAFEKKYPGVTVEVVGKKTTAGIKYIQETKSNNGTDLFWASAPDAFEVLKGDNLLAKYTSKVKGIPSKVGSYPVNDPDGFYTGFAAAGYGMMWNTRYLKANKLPAPKEWIDLAKPIYFGHTGMSAPSRSGTTHLTVETLLQGDGFNKGWAKMKNIAANFKTVTARSFGVPDGVNSGDFGVGIVIDFFGLSSIGSGFPVGFVYPTVTTLVPANIGVIKNAPNSANAKLFIDFLLTPEGQEILLDPKIRRLPVNPKTYSKAPKDFPNPFKDSSIGAAVKFDVLLSKSRYNLVNSLFDVMITYRLDDLRDTMSAIYKAEKALGNKNNPKAKKLIADARALVAKLPISEAKANDPAFNKIFKKKRKKAKDISKYAGTRQAEVEADWDKQVVSNYKQAKQKAEQALKSL